MDDLSYLGLVDHANFLFPITLHIFIACVVCRIMSLKDVYVLISGIRECVLLHGMGALE